MPCMEWQNHKYFMIIGGLEDSNPPITAKGALLMEKQKMESCPECSDMQETTMS